MKKPFVRVVFNITVAAALAGFICSASAQLDSGVLTNFLNETKTSGDSQLDSIASQLTDKAQALETSASNNTAVNTALNSSLSSLASGNYSSGLTSALGLASLANLSPGSLNLSKQVGNLAAAYVVKKNFSALAGSETDVTNAATALASGSVSQAVPPIKNIAANTNCTAVQKQLIYSVATNYVPGYAKIGGFLNGVGSTANSVSNGVSGTVNDAKSALKKFGF